MGGHLRAGIAVAVWAMVVSAALQVHAVEVVGRQATLKWEPARGPVDLYTVYVSRDGGAFLAERTEQRTRTTVSGRFGEKIRVRVAAVGKSNGRPVQGPFSASSTEIVFVEGSSKRGSRKTTASRPGPSASLPTVSVFGSRWRFAGTGDFDADGHADVVSRFGNAVLVQLMRNGRETARTVLMLRDAKASLAIGDRRGDGYDDLFATSRGGRVQVLEMRGTRVIAEETLSKRLTSSRGVIAGDVDGDGWTDLVSHSRKRRRASVWFLEGSGHEERTRFPRLQRRERMVVGDFDSDDDADLLVWGGSRKRAELWLSEGRERPEIHSIGEVRGQFASLSAGDADGDGRSDLVGVDARGRVKAWMMAGSRVRYEVELGLVDPGSTLHPADLDGDGDDDLLVVSPDGSDARALYVEL